MWTDVVVRTVIQDSPPLWIYVLLGFLPSAVAFIGYWLAERQAKRKRVIEESKRLAEKKEEQRQNDRKEDQLWGYVDFQGVRHTGIVDTVNDLKQEMNQFLLNFERYLKEDEDHGKRP